MALLTDRVLAQSSAITPTTLIHIVTTADTSQNSAGSSYKAELSQLIPIFSGASDTYTTGGTYSAGTITFTDNNGGTFDVTGLTLNFTGGSGNCITDFYVTNVHGCSPITIHDQVQSLGSTASGLLSFAFGTGTTATGDYSHAEGYITSAIGLGSHAEGGVFDGVYNTYTGGTSYGLGSHAEGTWTLSFGESSHAEGWSATSYGWGSHAEGESTFASGESSHSEGRNTLSEGYCSHSEGYLTKTLGSYSHSEGQQTSASTIGSHSEGFRTKTSGNYSHSEGVGTVTGEDFLSLIFIPEGIGYAAHSEGFNTSAYGYASHAEGVRTKSEGEISHSEGTNTLAIGEASHAEGSGTTAIGDYSHAEGVQTSATTKGSHTEGLGTITNADYQHACGQYNYPLDIQSAFMVGNGSDDLNRSNVFTAYGNVVNVLGNLFVTGNTNIGGTQVISTTGITAATFTITYEKTYWGVDYNGNVDLMLPSPLSYDGYNFYIKDEGGYAGTYRIRLTPSAGFIDGNNYVDMNINYMSLHLVARNNNWWII